MKPSALIAGRLGPIIVGFAMFTPWALVRLWLIVKGRAGWSGGYFWVTDVETHSLGLHPGRDLLLLGGWLLLMIVVCVGTAPLRRQIRVHTLIVAPLLVGAAAGLVIYLPAVALGGWLPGSISRFLNEDSTTARLTWIVIVVWASVGIAEKWASSIALFRRS